MPPAVVTSAYKYLILADDLTEAQKQGRRDRCIHDTLQRAQKLNIIGEESEALIKHPDTLADFTMAAGGWVSAAFAVVGTAVSIFNALTPAIPANRMVVFYGVWVDSLPLAANLLSFREGVAAGSTYAVFNMEELASAQSLRAFFSEPVWYDPLRVMNVTLTPRIVAGTQRIGLMGFVIEPKGPTVSQ
jgi:hypothetical protein